MKLNSSKIASFFLAIICMEAILVLGGPVLWSYKTGYAVWSVSISSDGRYVAAGSWDNRVYLLTLPISSPTPTPTLERVGKFLLFTAPIGAIAAASII